MTDRFCFFDIILQFFSKPNRNLRAFLKNRAVAESLPRCYPNHALGIWVVGFDSGMDLRGKPAYFLTEYGQGYRRLLDKELAKKSPEITPVPKIGRTDIIASLLADSDMISFLPNFVTREQVEVGTLCYLDVADVNIDIRKQLICRKNKWMSKSRRTFIEYIQSHEFSI